MKKNTCKPCWRQMLKKNRNWCPIQGNNFLPRKSHVVSCASLTRKSVQISGWGCRHARIDFMPQLFMPRSKIFQDIPTFRIMIHKCHKTLDCEVRMSVTSKFPEIFDVGMSSLRFFPGPEWPERWPCASWRDKMWQFGFGQFRNLDRWRNCWLNLNLLAWVELGGTSWNLLEFVGTRLGRFSDEVDNDDPCACLKARWRTRRTRRTAMGSRIHRIRRIRTPEALSSAIPAGVASLQQAHSKLWQLLGRPLWQS